MISDVLRLGQGECQSLLVCFVGPLLAGLTIPTVRAVVARADAAYVERTLAATRPRALRVAELVARCRVLGSEGIRTNNERDEECLDHGRSAGKEERSSASSMKGRGHRDCR